jgi:hypothetical protein
VAIEGGESPPKTRKNVRPSSAFSCKKCPSFMSVQLSVLPHFSLFKWCSSVQVGEASGRSSRRGTKIAAERPKSRPCGIQYIAVVHPPPSNKKGRCAPRSGHIGHDTAFHPCPYLVGKFTSSPGPSASIAGTSAPAPIRRPKTAT